MAKEGFPHGDECTWQKRWAILQRHGMLLIWAVEDKCVAEEYRCPYKDLIPSSRITCFGNRFLHWLRGLSSAHRDAAALHVVYYRQGRVCFLFLTHSVHQSCFSSRSRAQELLPIANWHVPPFEEVLRHWHSSSIIEKTWDSPDLSLLIPSHLLQILVNGQFIHWRLSGQSEDIQLHCPRLDRVREAVKGDDSPNFHINRLHCGDQYYQMDWMQEGHISEIPHAHIYSVYLWEQVLLGRKNVLIKNKQTNTHTHSQIR